MITIQCNECRERVSHKMLVMPGSTGNAVGKGTFEVGLEGKGEEMCW